jgi:DNA-binding sugar fermentation-stimulating protein
MQQSVALVVNRVKRFAVYANVGATTLTCVRTNGGDILALQDNWNVVRKLW